MGKVFVGRTILLAAGFQPSGPPKRLTKVKWLQPGLAAPLSRHKSSILTGVLKDNIWAEVSWETPGG